MELIFSGIPLWNDGLEAKRVGKSWEWKNPLPAKPEAGSV
jgi:hypothetical protein